MTHKLKRAAKAQGVHSRVFGGTTGSAGRMISNYEKRKKKQEIKGR